ncbi:molybdate ABC transporter substrate-binding protein [Bacillus sp. ISL-47]|uniref:molybdate ABC transporter substrate-binding protein n=1 Tax=Bacillus sp. ISL-47 TaxID=2819130 RepID=UPI001BEBD099|nr:molybdate ABC transporter substrate-binding protein [Bacillus sp. ISL-47]MBT2690591.1 molybdate ABC transporter substrate-binding protein [Bacillus sp. ISL-47]MBT2708153.1 molybdate ABC transporter substrate-binding protein [Pseudomonas sp. ISL-84]
MKRKLVMVFLVFIFVLCGCGQEEIETKKLYIVAASDLYHALTEIGDEFTRETGIELEFTFGSTGLLTQQIQEGAPFDLFAAAQESYIDKLIEKNAVEKNSKQYYALGRIAILSSDSDSEEIKLDKLLSPEVKSITIANPDHAPYGKAAKEALEALDIWSEIEPKIVYAENIRQAFQYVESGNADAGIIALALLQETDLPYVLIDEKAHSPIKQTLAIPIQSEKKEESKKFTEFLLSKQGQEILEKYGFDLP